MRTIGMPVTESGGIDFSHPFLISCPQQDIENFAEFCEANNIEHYKSPFADGMHISIWFEKEDVYLMFKMRFL